MLLPLDITTPHELSFPLYQECVDRLFENTSRPSKPEEKPPLVHFTSAFFERTREVMIEFGKDAMELHDVVAVWFAANNPPCNEEHVLPKLIDGWEAHLRLFQVERYVYYFLLRITQNLPDIL